MRAPRCWLSEEQIERAKRLRELGLTYENIAIRLGTTKGVIHKLQKRGWRRHIRQDRPIPWDFSTNVHLSLKDLAKHYSAGLDTIYRWLAEAKIERPCLRDKASKARIREMPEDFPWVAEGKSHLELQRHYRATGSTITRWKKEAELATPRSDYWARRKAPVSQLGWVEEYVRKAA